MKMLFGTPVVVRARIRFDFILSSPLLISATIFSGLLLIFATTFLCLLFNVSVEQPPLFYNLYSDLISNLLSYSLKGSLAALIIHLIPTS